MIVQRNCSVGIKKSYGKFVNNRNGWLEKKKCFFAFVLCAVGVKNDIVGKINLKKTKLNSHGYNNKSSMVKSIQKEKSLSP